MKQKNNEVIESHSVPKNTNLYHAKPKEFLFNFKLQMPPRERVKNMDILFEREALKEDIILKVRHLDVTYGSGFHKKRAVRDISFNLYKGEILAIVGESGSGKSTTANVIAGLVGRSYGSLELLGRELPYRRKKANKDLREFLVKNLQMIFQDPAGSLNPHKNIWKVVKEGLDNVKDVRTLLIRVNLEDSLRLMAEYLNNIKSEHEPSKSRVEVLHLIQKDLDAAANYLYKTVISELQDKKLKDFEKLTSFFQKQAVEYQKLVAASDLKQLKKEWVVRILKSVGLDDSVLTRFPLEFSGGQQQRIGISRALATRPTLLIADEPISALDVSIQAQVINIFNDLKTEYDLTMILIAHDLRMVEYVSDRIIVMYKGVIVEVGKAHDIAKNSLHPYTKSLLDAVPSLESKKGSLIGFVYNPEMHPYTASNQPQWFKVAEEHYVLATAEEFNDWKNGNYQGAHDEKEITPMS